MRFFAMLCVGIFLTACASENPMVQMRNDLCRKWKYDIEAIRAEAYSKTITVSEQEYLEGALEAFENGYVEFKTDGTLILSNTGTATMEGTWDFADEGKMLKMNIYQRDDFAPIEQLSPERLILGKQSNSVVFRRIFIPAE